MDSIYVTEHDRFAATELARSPWDPGSQHGGAPAALLVRELEREEPGPPLARVSFEFLRPVPLVPLAARARMLRGGRRVQLLEAELLAGDEPVCRAIGLRIRREERAAPAVPPAIRPLPPPDSIPPTTGGPPGLRPMFAGDGMELRFIRGRYDEPGPAAAWLRLRAPLVAGEQPSPVQRAAAAADFGNGVSAALDWTRYVFINPDLTLHLAREPEGEWIGLDSVTAVDPAGVGIAESVVHDERGPVGRAVQALYVGRR